MNTKNKTSEKAFTLVELIVVITILAILGTIAFINLAWYNKQAKNGKVTSDLRNIASAIEVARSRNGISLREIVKNASSNNTVDLTNVLNNGSTTLWGTWVTYAVWNVNFSVINQNWDNFKDPNSFDAEQEYIYWMVNSDDFAYYQMAGHIIENDIQKVRVIGTYSPVNTSTDVVWILSTQLNDSPLEDDMVIVGDLYQ